LNIRICLVIVSWLLVIYFMLEFKTEKFQGPLGLLLELIEKEELDITEVSLAKIADQYIDYIKNNKNIDPGKTADFLVIAAKLLFIKSKALLPYLYPEEDEEIEELEGQLRMYREFLEAMKKVEGRLDQEKIMFAREFNKKNILSNIGLFFPPKKLDAQILNKFFKEIISQVKIKEDRLVEEKIEDKINIEDRIFTIHRMVLDKIKLSFNKIFAGSKSKTETIVNFLAILELIKQRNISADQGELFSEIVINRM